MPEQLLRIPAVAGRLGYTRDTVYAMVRRGELPAVRIRGQQLRVRESDLDAWIAAQPPFEPEQVSA